MARAIKKTSVTKKAVIKVKETPKKIVEHTLSTAIETVEKAAVRQEERTQKANQKQIEKIAKKVAQTAQKRNNKKTSKVSVARCKAREIKNKIKNVLHPQKNEVFHYSTKKIIQLNLLYALLNIGVWLIANCMHAHNLITNWTIFTAIFILMILSLSALASSVFVMLFPQPLAEINSKSIKIDHNQPLKWQDVEIAEEIQTNKLTKRTIIVLHTRIGARYKLTFMQKLCKNSLYTPFSIPLYAMTENDAKTIRKLIQKYAKYTNNINN